MCWSGYLCSATFDYDADLSHILSLSEYWMFSSLGIAHGHFTILIILQLIVQSYVKSL